MCTEMKLSQNFKDVMKRYEMGFLNEYRECTFREDVPVINISGKKYGPFVAGESTTLPNWVIENLLKHEKVDISSGDAYESIRKLQNLSREEEKHPHALQTFQPYLYAAIARKTLRLESDKTSMDPRKYDEVEKLRKITPILVETRLSKILRVAKSGAYLEKRNQMAHEERWLCEELVELLSGWRQNVME